MCFKLFFKSQCRFFPLCLFFLFLEAVYIPNYFYIPNEQTPERKNSKLLMLLCIYIFNLSFRLSLYTQNHAKGFIFLFDHKEYCEMRLPNHPWDSWIFQKKHQSQNLNKQSEELTRARARAPKEYTSIKKSWSSSEWKVSLVFFLFVGFASIFPLIRLFVFFPQIFFVDSFQFHADEEWTSKKVNRNHFTFNWIQFTSFYLFLVEFNRMEKFSFFSCFTLCCSSKFIPGYLNMLRLFKIKTNVKLIK